MIYTGGVHTLVFTKLYPAISETAERLTLLMDMEKVTDSLLQNTAMGIFAAILLIGLVLFANWTRIYVEKDRENKEGRISALEGQVHSLQDKFNNELFDILMKHEAMMTNMQATFNRMEKLWERMEKKLDDI